MVKYLERIKDCGYVIGLVAGLFSVGNMLNTSWKLGEANSMRPDIRTSTYPSGVQTTSLLGIIFGQQTRTRWDYKSYTIAYDQPLYLGDGTTTPIDYEHRVEWVPKAIETSEIKQLDDLRFREAKRTIDGLSGYYGDWAVILGLGIALVATRKKKEETE